MPRLRRGRPRRVSRTACSATRPARRPTRAARCSPRRSPTWSRSSTREGSHRQWISGRVRVDRVGAQPSTVRGVTRPRVSGRARLKRRRDGPRAAGAKRVALVTGAARGIGAATVKRLALDGFHVIALDRAEDDPRLPYALGTADELHAPARASGSSPSPPTRATPAARRGGRGHRAPLGRARRDRRRGGRDRGRRAARGSSTLEQEQAVLDVNLGGVLTAARVGIPALLAPRAARRALHRGRLHGRDARPAEARRLLRGQGGRGRLRARAGGRARRDRHHRQRRQPRLHPHQDPRRDRAPVRDRGRGASPTSSRSGGCSSPRRSRR